MWLWAPIVGHWPSFQKCPKAETMGWKPPASGKCKRGSSLGHPYTMAQTSLRTQGGSDGAPPSAAAQTGLAGAAEGQGTEPMNTALLSEGPSAQGMVGAGLPSSFYGFMWLGP